MQWTLEGINPAPVYKKVDDRHSGIVEPSTAMRKTLREKGDPVIVAFSRGKDSIAALIALLADGVDVIPVHLYRVPGLKFEEDSLKAFEDTFQMRIHNLPHRDFWYYLANGVAMAPWQNATVEAGRVSEVPYDLMWTFFKMKMGLPKETWIADGVRAADSPYRRMNIVKNGPWARSIKQAKAFGLDWSLLKLGAHVVWDWKMAEIRKCMDINRIKLPIDYDLFGRTFDGLDYRFTKPLSEHLPDDYERLLEWFPLAETDFIRHEYLSR